MATIRLCLTTYGKHILNQFVLTKITSYRSAGTTLQQLVEDVTWLDYTGQLFVTAT